MRPPLQTLLLALCTGLPMAVGAGALPTLMSTNICADTLALSLAAPQQILSLSRQSQDAQRFSLAAQARQFPANDATAEDVLHLQPQVVLASRRWNARQQTALLQRHGVQIVTVPFPTDWEGIFSSTRKMGQALGREAAAQALALECVDAEGRRLADGHLPGLAFLEVGHDPQAVRHQEQRRVLHKFTQRLRCCGEIPHRHRANHRQLAANQQR